LLDGQPPAGQSEGTDAVRRVVRKDSHRSQPQIEIDFLLASPTVDLTHCLDQFDTVPDGDVSDHAALAGQ
jgi:hypothetical protein